MSKNILAFHAADQVGEAVRVFIQVRMIDLVYIPGENYLGSFPGPGDHCFYFMGRQVLGLVDNEISFLQAAAANISQRGNK